MEKIIYIVVSIVGVIVAYLFGHKSNSNDGRGTLDGVNESIGRTVSGLDNVSEHAEELNDTVGELGTEISDVGDEIHGITDAVGESTDRIETVAERNERIKDLVSELRRRAESRENKDDSN